MPQYCFHIDSILTLEGDDTLEVKIGQEDFMDWEALCPSIINFTMPRNQNFLQIFETTYNLFSAEWAALGEEATKLRYEYGRAPAQLEREAFGVQQNANIQLQELQNQMAHIYQEPPLAKKQQAQTQNQLEETQVQLANTQIQLAAPRAQLNQTLDELRQMRNQHTATQSQLAEALEKLNEGEQQSVPDASQTTGPRVPPQKKGEIYQAGHGSRNQLYRILRNTRSWAFAAYRNYDNQFGPKAIDHRRRSVLLKE
ncbi:uncharacterized protein TM35_000211020 [Trypanosoma theileri]|uniref:Uncharacterized protein n=1 Tax=Trypanosoma theileri TaxID=67003 RepID=A0A1X0NS08_9TRYP|nr:uncharacterized protein TM35_000211020 [Trypanosoma theileri]ORC87496.1 hypothetical protein TM35_000211020 [Trypanosoma theileri]